MLDINQVQFNFSYKQYFMRLIYNNVEIGFRKRITFKNVTYSYVLREIGIPLLMQSPITVESHQPIIPCKKSSINGSQLHL